MVEGIDQWLLLVLLFGMLLAAEEGGYRVGQYRRGEYDEDGRGSYNNLLAGLYGLMGLLLAFTFAMAQGRFEARKELVVDEANAIGTAWLRADLVPEPTRGEIRALLLRYVEARTPAPPITSSSILDVIVESEVIHQQLWPKAVAAAKADPSPPVALLVSAVNDVFDMHSKRIAANRFTVPTIVILLVIAFAFAAAGVTGYRCGIGERRYRLPSAAFLLLVALVIGVIIDLDRPRRGFITVDQSPMTDLRASLRAAR
jgi:hypothetical protein